MGEPWPATASTVAALRPAAAVPNSAPARRAACAAPAVLPVRLGRAKSTIPLQATTRQTAASCGRPSLLPHGKHLAAGSPEPPAPRAGRSPIRYGNSAPPVAARLLCDRETRKPRTHPSAAPHTTLARADNTCERTHHARAQVWAPPRGSATPECPVEPGRANLGGAPPLAFAQAPAHEWCVR